MKKHGLTFSSLCAACLLAACSSPVTVTTDYDHAASFGHYKTYTLAPPKAGQTLAPISEAALRDTLRTQLAARGIVETSSGKADLHIVRHAFLKEKISVQQYTDWGYMGHAGWPYRYGYYGMWATAPVTYTDVNQYSEGTLILDFVDARTKKLVFRGMGKAVAGGPEENAPKIKEAVEKIVAEFPAGGAH
jgi:hypothetical protein